ncbi:MAG TPA: hypothetical protein VL461_14505 [Dictyobacter sp.]|jgi:hypothetical protein|nr:hypothetical protein [Dictyobacter sp.]
MQSQNSQQQIFMVSELAEYEYCPLIWWNEQYEPLVQADNEELFARLVEMEHNYGQQATAFPEYQVIEQILVRRNAFSESDDPEGFERLEQDEYEYEIAEEQDEVPDTHRKLRQLQFFAIVTLTLALFVLLVAWISMSLP